MSHKGDLIDSIDKERGDDETIDLDASAIKENGPLFFARHDIEHQEVSRQAFLISLDDPEGRRETDVSIYLVAQSVDPKYDARLVSLGTRRIRVSRLTPFARGTDSSIVLEWCGFRLAAYSSSRDDATACSDYLSEAGGCYSATANKRRREDETPASDQMKELKRQIDDHALETKEANFKLHYICQLIYSTGYDTQMRMEAVLSMVNQENNRLKEENRLLQAEVSMYKQLNQPQDVLGMLQPVDGYYTQQAIQQQPMNMSYGF